MSSPHPPSPAVTHLSLKPDLSATIQRFEAWWHRDVLDRPPVTLHVESNRPYDGPESHHATPRERWLDVEFQVRRQLAHLERREFLGDTLPTINPNVGPELTATLLGSELEFSDTTSWSTPIIHDPDAWDRIIHQPADFENIYWQTIEAQTRLALELGRGRCLVGIADLHNSYDILAALRDPQALCLDIIDCPDTIAAVGKRAAAVFVEAFERNQRLIAEAGLGSTTWIPMYHQGPAYVPSCDFWCMVSAEHARSLILPAILDEIKPMARSIFHLDGPQALRHLDLLLQIKQLDAVQWVYGAGNGPASQWIDVYRRIQAAGKSMQILATNPPDALTILDALDSPAGVWLNIDTPFPDSAAADDFLTEVRRRT